MLAVPRLLARQNIQKMVKPSVSKANTIKKITVGEIVFMESFYHRYLPFFHNKMQRHMDKSLNTFSNVLCLFFMINQFRNAVAAFDCGKA